METKNTTNNLDPRKDSSLREYLIDRILEDYEPDHILIDLLNVDLLYLAERELEDTPTETLKQIFENN